jgi:hypothetical protein
VSNGGEDGGTLSDRPDDEISDEPVVEVRVELVLKLSEVLAAEDRASGAWSEQEDGGVRMED